MIFEVNRDYLRRKLLPGLVDKFLNPTGEQVLEAAVIDANGMPVLGGKPRAADAEADLFPVSMMAPFGGGRERGGSAGSPKRWTLLTWHKAAGSRDRGPGIASEDMPRIFEPFYSGEISRRNQVRGTGLGLSLVKQTVEMHGGTLQAANMESGGAEFLIRLPAAAGEMA